MNRKPLLGNFIFLGHRAFKLSFACKIQVSISPLNPGAVLAVLFLAILSTVIAFFCYNYALTKIPAAQASIFINAVPVIAAFSAVFILDESLHPTQILGGICVILAVTITSVYGN